MDYAFYIASALGALAVWMMMPAQKPKPTKLGALIGIVALGGLMVHLLNETPAESRPSLYFYVFSFLAIASAVRVITHPRPVYSALFFVMVILSGAGLFVVLEAEFMAFAMIIIYAGAILVTYLFVIMLATLPQAEGQEEQSPLYDRVASEPLSSALVGFALVAVISSALFAPGVPTASLAELSIPPENVLVNSLPQRVAPLLVERGAITKDQASQIGGYVPAGNTLEVHDKAGALIVSLPMDGPDNLRKALADRLANIDQVGLSLFEGHALGIELAGIILLLSMVGAIVIGRKQVAIETDLTPTPGAGGATARPTGEPGPASPEVLQSVSTH